MPAVVTLERAAVSAVASAGPGSGVPAERSMCPREMWFSVVGRAEPAVSLPGAAAAAVHPESGCSCRPLPARGARAHTPGCLLPRSSVPRLLRAREVRGCTRKRQTVVRWTLLEIVVAAAVDAEHGRENVPSAGRWPIGQCLLQACPRQVFSEGIKVTVPKGLIGRFSVLLRSEWLIESRLWSNCM